MSLAYMCRRDRAYANTYPESLTYIETEQKHRIENLATQHA